MSDDVISLTNDDLMLINNTDSAEAFSKLNFDDLLTPNGIVGTESYLVNKITDEKIEGFEVRKHHVKDPAPTRYFVRTEDINMLPAIVLDKRKVHSQGNVFYLCTKLQSFSYEPEKIFSWREIIDFTGIPCHTNPIHYSLYKNKVLFGRVHKHVYHRVVSESAFGKDKYLEWWRHLINNSMNVSDPSTAKLFYAVCHNRDVTINELPTDLGKSDFGKFTNMLMRLGDGSNDVANPSRATKGTKEVADTSLTTLRFLHNTPKYYHEKNKPCFDEIFPYNVVNRYYYNLYDGYLQASFPNSFNASKVAVKYSYFYKWLIRSVLWYEEHWDELENLYPDYDLSPFVFRAKEERFKDHFFKFAKCLSHYALSVEEYSSLLIEEYKSHRAYESLVGSDDWKVEEVDMVERNKGD
jgi:hypothetical protein